MDNPRLKHPNKHIPPSNIIYLTVLLKFNFWVACQPTNRCNCHPTFHIYGQWGKLVCVRLLKYGLVAELQVRMLILAILASGVASILNALSLIIHQYQK